ncbi:MAG: hypothetical protein Q4E73_02735 [Lachnospiraceae bacterium]|nr:hypothetical protein [Lachnospiraceae bacterium]
MKKNFLLMILALCMMVCLVSCKNTKKQSGNETTKKGIELSGEQRDDKMILKEKKLLLPGAEYSNFQREYPGIRWIDTFPDSKGDHLTKVEIEEDDYIDLVRMIENADFQVFKNQENCVPAAAGGVALYCDYQQKDKKGKIEIKAVSDQYVMITNIADDEEESKQMWIADSQQLNQQIKNLTDCKDFNKDIISECEKVVVRIYDLKTKQVAEKTLNQEQKETWNQILKNSEKVLDIDAEVPCDVAIEYTAGGKTYEMTTSFDLNADGNIGIQGNYYKINTGDYEKLSSLLQ